MADDWVVDSLLGFLHSPVWRCPIDKFIEQNCTVFDTDAENKFSFTEIHVKYREMVDGLLENFTADLGITPKQLGEACTQSSSLGENHQSLFEQILATEDFLLFKSIMVQRNIDLELQALKLVQQKLGHSPEAYQHGSARNDDPIERTQMLRRAAVEEEERILQKVLEESKKEFERQKSLEEEEMQKRITLAKRESLKLIEVSQSSAREKQDDARTSEQEKEVISSPSKEVNEEMKTRNVEQKQVSSTSTSRQESSEDPKAPPLPSHTPTHTAQDRSCTNAASQWLESAKADIGRDKISTNSDKLATASNLQDIKAREVYLRRQRDYLIKMKNQARAEKFGSSRKDSTVAKVSPSKAPLGATTSVNVQTKSNVAGGLSPLDRDSEHVVGKKMSSTGVLCSAIADKLKIN